MNRTKYFLTALIQLSLIFFTEKTIAHPHIFLTNSIEAVFTENGLDGFNTVWVADEFSTAGLLDGYDENDDGEVDKRELKLFEHDSFTHLKASRYFSSVSIDGQPFDVTLVKDFSATLSANKLTYRFFIPCRADAGKAMREVTIAQYDSNYYSYIGFEKENPVAVKKSAAIEVAYEIAENKNEAYYFGQFHPTALILRFKK